MKTSGSGCPSSESAASRRPSGPAFHPVGDELHRAGGKLEPVLRHQPGCFGDGEREIASANFGQLPGQPVAVQRQAGVDPGGRYQAQARPGVLQQVGQFLQWPGRGQEMKIIKDQDHRRLERGQG